MKALVCSCAALVAALSVVVPVLAQPAMDPVQAGAISSAPVPNSAEQTQGITSDQAVNPAPNATNAYIEAGAAGFYDVDARIAHVEQATAALPSAQRRKAVAMLRALKAEEKTQIARHGQLRDWDRENLNTKLDQMTAQFPGLAG